MLSILIPTYNWDITELIGQLVKQLKKEKVVFEILANDDASLSIENEKNIKLNSIDNVSFTVSKFNTGLAINRNHLAKRAKYKYLLFIDADASISGDYIKKYLSSIDANTEVVNGGTKYSDKETKNVLRLKYGVKREQIDLSKREKNPYNTFFANNFLIRRDIFEQINFDESLNKYGHEDTVFKLDLKKNNIKIKHIQAPVTHLGLYNNDIFIRNTELALINLHKLIDDKRIDSNEIRLVVVSYKYSFLLKFLNLIGVNNLAKIVASKINSLFWFDLWRLLTFNNTSN